MDGRYGLAQRFKIRRQTVKETIRSQFWNEFKYRVRRAFSWRICGADLLAAVISREKGPLLINSDTTNLQNAIIGVIPRALWPGKPLMTHRYAPETYIMLKHRLGDFDAMITRPTDAYASFGLVGVVVFGFLFGMFMHAIFLACFAKRVTIFGVAMYAFWFRYFIHQETDLFADFLVSMRGAAVLGAILFAVALLAKVLHPAGRSPYGQEGLSWHR